MPINDSIQIYLGQRSVLSVYAGSTRTWRFPRATMGMTMNRIGPQQITGDETISFNSVLTSTAGTGIPAAAAKALSIQSGFYGNADLDVGRSSIAPTAGYGSPGVGPTGYWECSSLTCEPVGGIDYPASATTTFAITLAFTDSTPGSFTAYTYAYWTNPSSGGFTSATSSFDIIPSG